MIAYNQLDCKNKFPRNPYDYFLGFIRGFTIGLIPLSLYILLKRNK